MKRYRESSRKQITLKRVDEDRNQNFQINCTDKEIPRHEQKNDHTGLAC